MPRWMTVALLTAVLAGGCGGKKEEGKSEDEKRALAKQAYGEFSKIEELCDAAYQVAGEPAGADEQSLAKAKQQGAELYTSNEVFAELVDEVHKNVEGAASPEGGAINYCDSKFQVPLHNRLMAFR